MSFNSDQARAFQYVTIFLLLEYLHYCFVDHIQWKEAHLLKMWRYGCELVHVPVRLSGTQRLYFFASKELTVVLLLDHICPEQDRFSVLRQFRCNFVHAPVRLSGTRRLYFPASKELTVNFVRSHLSGAGELLCSAAISLGFGSCASEPLR